MTLEEIAAQIANELEAAHVNPGYEWHGKLENHPIARLLMDFANKIKRECGVVFVDPMD